MTLRRTAPPAGQTGTWWRYEVATRSGRNRMTGQRRGTHAEVEQYLAGVLRRMERLEFPRRRWRDRDLAMAERRA